MAKEEGWRAGVEVQVWVSETPVRVIPQYEI
jgi:hypothetical protein